VSALLWNPHERELLSSHGFSNNQLTLWKYPALVRAKELTGHTARVLHMVACADGSMVASGGADETVRFWRVFGEAAAQGTVKPAGELPVTQGAAAAAAASGTGSMLRGLAIR